MSRVPETRVRSLGVSDTEAVLALLRRRPIHNVLLEHVVGVGALGRIPGFFGCEVPGGAIEAVLLVGSNGGASLEVCRDEAFAPLAACASGLPVRPRHITGSEDVTVPFWSEYAPRITADLLWERRERVYVADRGAPVPESGGRAGTSVRPAREQELDEVVENSAQQHLEDLKEDRHALDPQGFRARHLNEIREGHWWVLTDGRRICFQVHVGPRNASVIQLGGVFTTPSARARGYATRGLAALVARLHADRPRVSLFCDESNEVACRLYERVGFKTRHHNRSYLLRAPSPRTYA